MKAHLRRIRVSSKKANLVAGLVRGLAVPQALSILKFTPKKAAKILYKVLQSAQANAVNNHDATPETLTIRNIVITRGPFYKRHLPSTRGRALPIAKPTAHISIELQTASA